MPGDFQKIRLPFREDPVMQRNVLEVPARGS